MRSLDVYDTVVVGAGPSGSTVAQHVAAEGYKVLLVEEHERVGHPNHCAGLVTPRTLQIAELPSDGLIQNELHGAIIHSPSGRPVSIGGDRVHALAIDRPRFDAALAEKAAGSGARLLLHTRASQFERKGELIRVHLRNEHRAEAVETRLLIGADGARSGVAQWATLPGPDEVIHALNAHVRLGPRSPRFVEVYLSKDLAPGWFGWIIPLGDGQARLGIGTTRGTPTKCLKGLIAAFPRRFSGMEILSTSGGVIPLGLPDRIHADNVLLVGDAACQVKPTSGGGVYTGLLAARNCAQTALQSLREDDLSADSLSRYQTCWMEQMGEEVQIGALLRRIFVRLDNNDFDGLLRLLSSQTLRRMVARYGDIDHPSRAVSKLVGAFPWLSALWPLAGLISDRDELVRHVFALVCAARE